jgi:hypothetical protein
MSRIEQPNDRSANLWLNKDIRIGVSRRGSKPDGAYAYHWSVSSISPDFTFIEGGDDIHGPATGVDPGPLAMLGTLLSFLEACGESYSHTMRHPGSEPENLGLFPESMHEWCYQWSDEIAMARLEIEGPTDDESHAEEERRNAVRQHDLGNDPTDRYGD